MVVLNHGGLRSALQIGEAKIHWALLPGIERNVDALSGYFRAPQPWRLTHQLAKQAALFLAWGRREILRTAFARAFILLAIPLGIVIGSITPQGQVDDEATHMCRALALLHGTISGKRVPEITPDGRLIITSGVMCDPGIVRASFGALEERTPANFAKKAALRWTYPVYVDISPDAFYFPVFLVPSAIGIGLAHLVGLRPYQAVYAGRFVAFLYYASAGLLALMLARRGQAMIFLALSMPMALTVGASCSQDGPLLATTALGAALFSRGAWRWGALCMALVILVKPPYVLLALPLLMPLPPVRAWLAARVMLFKRLAMFAIIVLPGVVWFIYTMKFVSAPKQWPAYHPGPLWPGDPATLFYATNPTEQLRTVMAHPRTFLLMVWSYFVPDPKLYWLAKGTVGILGWLQILLPSAIYKFWLFGAAGALIADMAADAETSPTFRDCVLLLTGIIITIVLIWLSQYLNWSLVGSTEIGGPCGRYLLPLIPLLGLALPSFAFPHSALLRRVAMALPILAAFGTLVLLPHDLAIGFYLN